MRRLLLLLAAAAAAAAPAPAPSPASWDDCVMDLAPGDCVTVPAVVSAPGERARLLPAVAGGCSQDLVE